MRALAGLLVLGLTAFFGGCVPAQQHQELEFRHQKLQSERDSLQAALKDEQAKSAALADRLATAEAEARRDRLTQLQQKYDELNALIEQRAGRPAQRPAVSAALLPAELDQALEQFAAKFSHRVWYDRGRGAITFANDPLFEPGSDVVRTEALVALQELAAVAAAALPADYDLTIVGHTDDTPITRPDTLARHPTNWHLSVHRAIAVKDVLVSAGLGAERIGVMGYGPERPVGDERSRNRRVEIFFVPRGSVQSFAPVRPGR
jgi:chemotaxis protein MotB